MSVAYPAISNNNNDSSLVDHHDHGIGRSGFAGQKMACFSMYGSGNNAPPEISGGAGVAVGRKVVATEEEENRSGDSSSSTSSIGRNSDEESSAGRSSEGGGGDGEEVQSKYKGGALDSLEVLEEVLPIKYVAFSFFLSNLVYDFFS